MENASKALIIAGAILLSILIIALGMGVFNTAKEAMSGSSLSAEKAATYNEQFEKYMGEKKKGSEARSLCEAIRNHNLTTDDSESYPIYVTYKKKNNGQDVTKKSEVKTINQIITYLKSGNLYKITVEDYNTDLGGIIEHIKIEEL